jgi:hypothetical protein
MTTPKFITVHRLSDNEPIFIAPNHIAVISVSRPGGSTFIDIGNVDYTFQVKESPETIIKLIKGE